MLVTGPGTAVYAVDPVRLVGKHVSTESGLDLGRKCLPHLSDLRASAILAMDVLSHGNQRAMALGCQDGSLHFFLFDEKQAVLRQNVVTFNGPITSVRLFYPQVKSQTRMDLLVTSAVEQAGVYRCVSPTVGGIAHPFCF